MNYPFRVFLFKHYWWMTVLLVAITVPILVTISRPENMAGNVIALGAGALGVVYFVQKQKLEELQLSERLFTKFNERYAGMNSDLNRIASAADTFQKDAHEIMDRYFNLCAEEYLFYQQGHILPTVWQAWCRGMKELLRCERIRKYWDEEQGKDSYYGLTTEVINRGARWPNRAVGGCSPVE